MQKKSEYFSAEFFQQNRNKLRKKTATDLIVIAAHGQVQRNGDMPFPFRQDSSFWYLTGIQVPDLVLVMHEDKEFIIVPDRDHVRVIFDGAPVYEELTRESGVKYLYDGQEGWEKLEKLIKKSKKVATLQPGPVYVDVHDFYTNPARKVLVDKLLSIKDSLEIVDIRPQLAAMRMVKQKPELQAIKDAVTITSETIADIFNSLADFSYEYEIDVALTYGFRKRGAAGVAFDSIVASGKNTCILHHADKSSKLPTRGLLLLDVGAEVCNYAADISRTVMIGEPTKRERQLFDAVTRMHAFASSQLQVGRTIREYEKIVEAQMGEELKRLGVIKEISRETVRQYFPHATSHSLGLDTHDAADYDLPIAPDMVFTVEPGIYIPDEGIGVRFEDDVLITENGIQNLSQNLPSVLA